jgi:RHS repeat-associated protein
VDSNASANIATFLWQGLGRLQRTTNQDGAKTDFGYDGFARVASIDHLLPGSAGSLHKLEYLYDKVHNRRMEKNSFNATWVGTLPSAVQSVLNARAGKGDVYRYDWASRLVDVRYDVASPASEVSTPGSQTYAKLVAYSLDGLGNRGTVQTTVPPGSPVTVTYAADVVNQYTSVGGTSRSQDSNGNVSDDGTLLFRYDYKNRLTEAKLKSTSASIATYKFDALGRRVEKAVAGGATTRYVYDGQDIVEEYDGSDAWQARYVFEDGMDHPRVMDRADVSDVDGDSNTSEVLRFTYHQNVIGSVTEITDPGGAVVEWTTYDVYGRPTIYDRSGTSASQSAVGNPFLFTGREYDAETGLYHYRARAYDPTTGRFEQRDPAGFTFGLSLYEYSRSGPSTWRDPMGLTPGDAVPGGSVFGKRQDPGANDAPSKEDREKQAGHVPDTVGVQPPVPPVDPKEYPQSSPPPDSSPGSGSPQPTPPTNGFPGATRPPPPSLAPTGGGNPKPRELGIPGLPDGIPKFKGPDPFGPQGGGVGVPPNPNGTPGGDGGGKVRPGGLGKAYPLSKPMPVGPWWWVTPYLVPPVRFPDRIDPRDCPFGAGFDIATGHGWHFRVEVVRDGKRHWWIGGGLGLDF